MVKVNDIVRFLNDVGGGKVTKIEGNIAYVEDQDGFERPVLTREVVVVDQAKSTPGAYEKPIKVKSKLVEPDKPAPKAKPQPAAPVYETNDGDALNVTLAYEAKELKHLTTTTFYAVLVNDSNYFLYFSYMTRSNDDSEWQTRYCGIVEPNIQVELDEFGHDDLNSMERVAVQYIAFKQGKGFKLKNPALVETKLDTTKFFKLHCFHDNVYFDEPVIAIDIVKNDLPARQLVIDSSQLERALKQKKHIDAKPHAATTQQHKPGKHTDIIEVDLHINELLDNTAGLSSADMLHYQLDKFREVMKANEKNVGQKIVFIHGKGEGVLRRAILDELRRKYPRCTVQDASFQEYGFGATQVTVHN